MIDILFEDEFCLIANKPNNMLVHHSYYARNIKDNSLLQLIRIQKNITVYPVHRLDRKTSGVILLCKNKKDVAEFQNLFTKSAITKKYIALVRGFCPETGKIDTPIKNNETNIYKVALTTFKKIKQFELDIPVQPYASSRYSIVEFFPKSGRTHQIRKHANKISHPIIGDHKYGNRHHNKMFVSKFKTENLFLHAFLLDFIHPITQNQVIVIAKLPDFWTQYFNMVDIDFTLPFYDT